MGSNSSINQKLSKEKGVDFALNSLVKITPIKIIKNAGYHTKRIKLATIVYRNPLNNRGTHQPLFMFDSEGKIFCINSIPYCPIGGNLVFAELVKGGLNQPQFSFKEFTIETY